MFKILMFKKIKIVLYLYGILRYSVFYRSYLFIVFFLQVSRVTSMYEELLSKNNVSIKIIYL